VAVEEAAVAQKDGGRHVPNQFGQIKIGKPVQFRAVNNVFARSENLLDVHLYCN
jgi:hypothetical protein